MILRIVNINSCVTSKLPIIKKKLLCGNRISYRQINIICLQCAGSLIIYLLLIIVIIQYIVKIGLVTESFIPNY